MRTAGIIAEYNPFHAGHQKQLDYVRHTCGADYIVIVMSGDFVQRGGPALYSKHQRAEAALRCGADLVLELPVSASSASAEFFARCGVEILDRIGVTDILCFGSEEGSLPLFQASAEVLLKEPDEYRNALKNGLKSGMSFPLARAYALEAYLLQTNSQISSADYHRFLSEPNNILGIEYCRSILALKSRIQPVTLKREGSGYHQQHLPEDAAPSASAVRKWLKEHPLSEAEQALKNHLPKPSLELLLEAARNDRLVFEEDLDTLLACSLFTETRDSLCQYPDVSRELAARIIRFRSQYAGFAPFTDLLKTKELTRTRIQRALLHILLRIRSIPSSPEYARVLGFRKDAAPLLSAIKKEGTIPLLTKAADAPRILSGSALQSFEETVSASNIYESILACRQHTPLLHEYQKPVRII